MLMALSLAGATIGSSLIGAAGSLLGGLFGKRSADKQNALYQQQLAQAQAQFDAQMDETIQRRVKDAQEAGIHPLFALGSSLGASPTVSSGSPPETGNAMGDAIARVGEILGRIPTAKAQIARDEAEAAFLNAQAARVTQETATRGRDAMGASSVQTFPYDPLNPNPGKAKYYRPEIPYSSAVGVRAGRQPGMIEITMPDGRIVKNYDPDLGLDEIGQLNYALQRARHYVTDVFKFIGDWKRRNAEYPHLTMKEYRQQQMER
jgi:hypothetical protein